MSARKGNILLPLISAIAVLVLLAAGYFYVQTHLSKYQKIQEITLPFSTPTPISSAKDETANWKTYTNGDLLISLKYPPDWNYYLIHESLVAFGPRELINANKDRLENPNIGALIGGKAWPILIENRKDNKYYYSGSEISFVSASDKKIVEENVSISGTIGKRYLITLNFEAPYIQPGDIIEVIRVATEDKRTNLTLSDQKYKQIFNQILSTFKFLE